MTEAINPKIDDMGSTFELLLEAIVWSDWKANDWSYQYNNTANNVQDTLENQVTLEKIKHIVRMSAFEIPLPNLILDS